METKIVISGQVHKDGVGDYYHMIHTAEQINQLYPSLNIWIIPRFNDVQVPAKLTVLDPSRFHTLLKPYAEINEATK